MYTFFFLCLFCFYNCTAFMVWCSVLFDKKNKLEKRFAIHALKFISKSNDSRSALRMVPILIMIHKPSFQIRAAFQLIFLCPSLENFPPSRLLRCTSLMSAHFWQNSCNGMNWNVLSPWSLRISYTVGLFFLIFPLTNLFGAAFCV